MIPQESDRWGETDSGFAYLPQHSAGPRLPRFRGLLDHLLRLLKCDVAAIHAVIEEQLVLQAYQGHVTAGDLGKLLTMPDIAAAVQEAICHQEHHLVSQGWSEPKAPRGQSQSDDAMGCEVRSWLIAPLVCQNRTVGILNLGSFRPHHFSEQDVKRLSDFAPLLAACLFDAQRCAEAERVADEGQALFGVQQALTSRLDLDTVLQLIVDEARRLTSAHTALLMLTTGDRLRLTALSGEYSPDIFMGYEIPIDRSRTGASIRLGKPVRVDDAWDNPDVYASHHLKVHNFLSFPLLSEAEAIGAIMVADKLSGTFSADDERIVTMLASSAVIAVENARLFREEQERRHEAEQRRQIAEGLRETLAILNSHEPLDEILDHIARQACRLLGSDACAVFRLDRVTDTLRIQAAHGLSNEIVDGLEVPVAHSDLGKVILSGQPVATPRSSLSNHVELPDSPRFHFFRQLTCSYPASVAIPLIPGSEVYGEMVLYYNEIHHLSDDEIELAMAFGDQVALAIENARLHAQAENLARLQERRRIAQALHDSVAQMLFTIGLEAEGALEHVIVTNARDRLQAIRRYAARSSYELRSAIYALRNSDTSGRHSLVELLEEQVADFQAQSGIAATCMVPSDVPDLPALVTEAIYRIVREALSNIRKHACASATFINLKCDEHSITLMIQDDGVGLGSPPEMEDADDELHFGVATMRHLVDQAQGDFSITNADEQGVLIKARFPIPSE